jgi:hypothetical protein
MKYFLAHKTSGGKSGYRITLLDVTPSLTSLPNIDERILHGAHGGDCQHFFSAPKVKGLQQRGRKSRL